ncbi:carbon-nitrogen hydrolase family protein [Massilia sp. TSP1-1-2]|uniref:carbon-nitrogen hydrolase family protein n=1 Tax=unclassified Massilia TaxID=2609279 RepID=UPI003CF570DA
MAGLRIAAAQSHSAPGDIAANVARHCVFIDAAVVAGVDLLVFPELSLSGYEPALLEGAALGPGEALLAPLAARAVTNNMTIVAGAPLRNPNGLPFIGAIAFHPDGRHTTYRKHFLHPGEEQNAAAGTAISQVIDVRGVPVALAICADTGNQQHPHAAVMAGATLYVAGSVITPAGYAKEANLLSGHAKLFNIGILLANHAFETGGYQSAGRSAIWLADGQLLVDAPGTGECLVIGDQDNGAVVPVSTLSCR